MGRGACSPPQALTCTEQPCSEKSRLWLQRFMSAQIAEGFFVQDAGLGLLLPKPEKTKYRTDLVSKKAVSDPSVVTLSPCLKKGIGKGSLQKPVTQTPPLLSLSAAEEELQSSWLTHFV